MNSGEVRAEELVIKMRTVAIAKERHVTLPFDAHIYPSLYWEFTCIVGSKLLVKPSCGSFATALVDTFEVNEVVSCWQEGMINHTIIHRLTADNHLFECIYEGMVNHWISQHTNWKQPILTHWGTCATFTGLIKRDLMKFINA
jgi:hypothetical protein